MKIIEEILRIKDILNLNEDSVESKNARKLDLLIKYLFGGIKQVRHLDSTEGEYVWIKDSEYEAEYDTIALGKYEPKTDSLVFYKNNWGRLWIINCDFFKAYVDQFVSEKDKDEGDEDGLSQRHYQIIKDYFKQRYNIDVKLVDATDCEFN